MDSCPPSLRSDLARLLRNEEGASGHAQMDSSHWKAWETFTSSYGQGVLLSSVQGDNCALERQGLCMAFARWLRKGRYHNGKQIAGTQIENTLRTCATILIDKGYKDPRRSAVNQKGYDKPLTDLLNQYKEEDPPPRPQLALPSRTFQWLSNEYQQQHQSQPQLLALADLVVLAFFFLFRVGEYMLDSPSRQKGKKTVPLRKQDMQLWHGDDRISNDAPLHILLTADKVSMALENQKNGHRDEMITHHSNPGSSFCPVNTAI